MIKPVLKFVGSKRRSLDIIRAALPEEPCEGLWVEPFIGSGAVFLRMRAEGLIPNVAILTDISPIVVATHVGIRDHVDDVLDELVRLPTHEDWGSSYYALRDAFNALPVGTPRYVALFLWLNRACYNGLLRTSKKSGFNAPKGAYKTLKFPNSQAFYKVSDLLQDTVILQMDFRDSLPRVSAGDYVYCDPPYVPKDDSGFTEYGSGKFTMEDQRVLAHQLGQAAERGALVLASNHDLPSVRELYPEPLWEVASSHMVGRSVNSNGKGRQAVPEILVRRVDAAQESTSLRAAPGGQEGEQRNASEHHE